MKILVFGSNGLVGSNLRKRLEQRSYQCFFSTRDTTNLFDLQATKKTIDEITPDVIINCIGITTRRISIQNQNLIEFINSKLPKVLSKYCDNNDIKFIHFSTDCVFSGKRGNYNEQDRPDASDIYGLSKSRAEKLNPNSLIIRSSMIGREIYLSLIHI